MIDALESEAIHIFREVAEEFDRPVIHRRTVFGS